MGQIIISVSDLELDVSFLITYKNLTYFIIIILEISLQNFFKWYILSVISSLPIGHLEKHPHASFNNLCRTNCIFIYSAFLNEKNILWIYYQVEMRFSIYFDVNFVDVECLISIYHIKYRYSIHLYLHFFDFFVNRRMLCITHLLQKSIIFLIFRLVTDTHKNYITHFRKWKSSLFKNFWCCLVRASVFTVVFFW